MTALSALRTKVYGRMGLPEDDTIVEPTDVTEAINEGLQMVAQEGDWFWTELAGTVTYTGAAMSVALPADWRATVAVNVDTNGFPLEKVPVDRVRTLQEAGATGNPVFYCDYGGVLRVAPVPSGTTSLVITYRAREETLSADVDTPLLPSEWDGVLVEAAAYLLFRRRRQVQEQAQALEAFARWAKNMRARFGLPESNMPTPERAG